LLATSAQQEKAEAPFGDKVSERIPMYPCAAPRELQRYPSRTPTASWQAAAQALLVGELLQMSRAENPSQFFLRHALSNASLPSQKA
jgi:hypothetical protein